MKLTPIAATVAVICAGIAGWLYFAGHGPEAGGFLAIAAALLGVVLHPQIP